MNNVPAKDKLFANKLADIAIEMMHPAYNGTDKMSDVFYREISDYLQLERFASAINSERIKILNRNILLLKKRINNE